MPSAQARRRCGEPLAVGRGVVHLASPGVPRLETAIL